jgi:hypothetical protein
MEYNESEQNPDCWNSPLNFFLVLLVIGLPFLYAFNVVGYPILIVTGFMYLVMLFECIMSKTYRFIDNLTQGHLIFSEIDHIRLNPPQIKFFV